MKTKFFEVLQTFSKEDYIKFGQFVNCDYFNSSEMLKKLYSSIIKYVPELSEEELTREKLFEELYPGKKYREGTIVNLLSGLYKLSEKYIAQAAFEEESFGRERYLLEGLSKRRLNKFVFKIYDETMDTLENTVIRDVEYFHIRHEIGYQHISFLGKDDKGYNISTEPIQIYHDSLHEYFVVKLLSIFAFMLNQKLYVRDYNFDMPLLEFLIEYMKKQPFDNLPTISIYFNLLMLIKEGDDKYFFRLKDLVEAHNDIFGMNERRNLYIYMINFCLTESRVIGVNKFTREAFELFRKLIEQRIYVTNENVRMDHLLYLNIVMTGLNVKEFEWVENFIVQYRDILPEEHKDSTFNLCYALFYFNTKEFSTSLKYLNKVHRKHVFFNLQVNSLILQNYYELGLFENAFSYIDSYRHYLKENSEIAAINKKRTKSFLDVVNKLLKIKFGTDSYEDSKFDITGEEYKTILKRTWILEKIEEVKLINETR